MLTTHSFSFPSFLAAALAATACGGAPDAAASASAEAESASTGAASAVRGHAVSKLGPVFGRPVQGVATAAEAHALQSKVEDDARFQASAQCAATLALPLGAVSTKLV